MSEKANDERMISEIIQYYNDYDGTLEESMPNWLISHINELKNNVEKEIECEDCKKSLGCCECDEIFGD